jgi:hypothetical protein
MPDSPKLDARLRRLIEISALRSRGTLLDLIRRAPSNRGQLVDRESVDQESGWFHRDYDRTAFTLVLDVPGLFLRLA